MERADRGFLSFLLYLLVFLLFWEWLRPLPTLVDIGNLDVLVLFSAFVFFLSYLQLPYWIASLIKGLVMLYTLHPLFFSGPIFHLEWVISVFHDLFHNITLLIAGQWEGFSDVFRTLLLLILICLLAYLLNYWMLQLRSMFVFFLATIVYVAIMDAYTPYHGGAAIVRTVVAGFILLGILRFRQFQNGGKSLFARRRLSLVWGLMLVSMVLVTSVVGLAAPKTEPKWPNPVPFLRSAAGLNPNGDDRGEDSSGFQRIGYDSNDTHLGGPFAFDHRLLFTVTTDEAHYWRVESKDVYTGKGWVQSHAAKMVPLHLDQYSAPDLYLSNVKTKQEQVKIVLARGRKFPQLVYPGELSGVNMPGNVHLEMNDYSGKIRMVDDHRYLSVEQYGLTFLSPEFKLEELKESDDQKDPITIKKRYLQLPVSLPEGIRTLTKKMTANAHNRYDKVKAVEQFLKSSDFSYDTQNVAIPGKGQDYVAQFLFDTKRGYCDNFSTSMAVMLRTIGIPTRWVKGFSPGTFEDPDAYQVTNANAHSWVEVYFPGSGWVPFDPTKGFSGIDDIVFSQSNAMDPTEAMDDPEKTNKPQKNTTQQPKTEKQPKSQITRLTSNVVNTLSDRGIFVQLFLAVVAFLLIFAGVLWGMRKKWLPAYVCFRYRHRAGEDVFREAYERLLKLLSAYGVSRRSNETLREYAVAVDRVLDTHEMKVLTSSYEKVLYQEARSADIWLESREGWEKVVKCLTSIPNHHKK